MKNEALEQALWVAKIQLDKSCHECKWTINKLEDIYNNRKPGDGYVAQEHLRRVIQNWEETLAGWREQRDALNEHIELLKEQGVI
jgi:hypothetical protein